MGYALIAGGIWEEDILTAEIEELKSWMHQKYIQKTECERSPHNPNRGEFVFLVADGSAKIVREETTNSKNPLYDGNPP